MPAFARLVPAQENFDLLPGKYRVHYAPSSLGALVYLDSRLLAHLAAHDVVVLDVDIDRAPHYFVVNEDVD